MPNKQICKTCKHFKSYCEIYEDALEPHDIGDCYKGDYPFPPDKRGLQWEDSCEGWEKYE